MFIQVGNRMYDILFIGIMSYTQYDKNGFSEIFTLLIFQLECPLLSRSTKSIKIAKKNLFLFSPLLKIPKHIPRISMLDTDSLPF